MQPQKINLSLTLSQKAIKKLHLKLELRPSLKINELIKYLDDQDLLIVDIRAHDQLQLQVTSNSIHINDLNTCMSMLQTIPGANMVQKSLCMCWNKADFKKKTKAIKCEGNCKCGKSFCVDALADIFVAGKVSKLDKLYEQGHIKSQNYNFQYILKHLVNKISEKNKNMESQKKENIILRQETQKLSLKLKEKDNQISKLKETIFQLGQRLGCKFQYDPNANENQYIEDVIKKSEQISKIGNYNVQMKGFHQSMDAFKNIFNETFNSTIKSISSVYYHPNAPTNFLQIWSLLPCQKNTLLMMQLKNPQKVLCMFSKQPIIPDKKSSEGCIFNLLTEMIAIFPTKAICHYNQKAQKMNLGPGFIKVQGGRVYIKKKLSLTNQKSHVLQPYSPGQSFNIISVEILFIELIQNSEEVQKYQN